MSILPFVFECCAFGGFGCKHALASVVAGYPGYPVEIGGIRRTAKWTFIANSNQHQNNTSSTGTNIRTILALYPFGIFLFSILYVVHIYFIYGQGHSIRCAQFQCCAGGIYSTLTANLIFSETGPCLIEAKIHCFGGFVIVYKHK